MGFHFFYIAAGVLLLESLTAEDVKKLEIIKISVLKSAENRETRKERVKKYLSWVSICMLHVSISICALHGIME